MKLKSKLEEVQTTMEEEEEVIIKWAL
jgi:hypothetical protein